MKHMASAASIGAIVAIAGIFAGAVLVGPSAAQAGKPWKSMTADYDFTGECVTDLGVDEFDADEGTTGGVACFTKSVFVPRSSNVLRVTWSATGDTHNGNSLWITCIITDARTNTRRYCIDGPSGAGGGAAGTPRGWISAQKLPVAAGGATNCNDGGGGAADCHDNSVHYTWCTDVPRADVYTIELRIASSLTGPESGLNDAVFVEDQVVFIDGTKIHGDNACVQREASAGSAASIGRKLRLGGRR